MHTELTSRTLVGGQLLVSLIRVPEAHEWAQVRSEILSFLSEQNVVGVILDLAQADILDEFDFKEILNTRSTVQLMGLSMVLTGLRPEVVYAWTRMVDLPSDLIGFASVQDALDRTQH